MFFLGGHQATSVLSIRTLEHRIHSRPVFVFPSPRANTGTDASSACSLLRDAWVGVADQSAASRIEVEITCSDPEQHRQRVKRVPLSSR